MLDCEYFRHYIYLINGAVSGNKKERDMKKVAVTFKSKNGNTFDVNVNASDSTSNKSVASSAAKSYPDFEMVDYKVIKRW